jgi:hypothetical protein
MNRLLTGAVTAAGSLALVGGVIVAGVTPASADDDGTGNSSYGSSATGPISSPPKATAVANGQTMVTANNVSIPTLLATGVTQDNAGAITAFSRVNNVRAFTNVDGVSATLTASQVESSCRSGADVGGPNRDSRIFSPDNGTATANIVSGVLTVNGVITHLPQHPTVDQTITVPGYGSVIMNDQFSPGEGGVAVRAVHVHVTATDPTEDLYLAVSVCHPGTASNIVTVQNPSAQTHNSGTAITPLHILASDSDPGQALTYSATGLPHGLSINPATGVITGTPTTGRTGPYTVTVTATDTSGAQGSTTFDWQINNVVSITNPDTQDIVVGTAVSLQIEAGDTDLGQVLTYGATGLPPGLSINSSTGLISGTPTTAIGTPFSVTVTVTDTQGFTNNMTFSFAATSPNIITVTPSTTSRTVVVSTSMTSITMTPTDTGTVTPTTPLTYTIASGSLPTGVTLNSTTGTISGTPGTTGTFTVTVRATDPTGASGVSATITITVSA